METPEDEMRKVSKTITAPTTGSFKGWTTERTALDREKLRRNRDGQGLFVRYFQPCLGSATRVPYFPRKGSRVDSWLTEAGGNLS